MDKVRLRVQCQLQFEQVVSCLSKLLRKNEHIEDDSWLHINGALRGLNDYIYHMNFKDLYSIHENIKPTLSEWVEEGDEDNVNELNLKDPSEAEPTEAYPSNKDDEQKVAMSHLKVHNVISIYVTFIKDVNEFNGYLTEMGIHPLLRELHAIPFHELCNSQPKSDFLVGSIVIAFYMDEQHCARAKILEKCRSDEFKVIFILYCI